MHKIEKVTPVSDWKPFSLLKAVAENISAYGYMREYIEANHLDDKKEWHARNGSTGLTNYFEPIEVMLQGEELLFREFNGQGYQEEAKHFETQFGTFNNHNNGEFMSWLGKDDYEGLPPEKRTIELLFGREDFFIEGNYCDMFDCGAYSYAVSNLMHLGLDDFKIVRIDKSLHTQVLYATSSSNNWTSLEYDGRFENEEGFVVIASGFIASDHGGNRHFHDKLYLFQISKDGTCHIKKEWGAKLSSPNSLVVLNEYAYFGQNKMITALNLNSGEMSFFTNKTDKELAALKPMR